MDLLADIIKYVLVEFLVPDWWFVNLSFTRLQSALENDLMFDMIYTSILCIPALVVMLLV